MTEIELVVAKIREEFGASDAKRDAGLTTPSDIQRFDNICYGKDPVWQSLDLYRPKSMDEKKTSCNCKRTRWCLGLWYKRNLSVLLYAIGTIWLCCGEL